MAAKAGVKKHTILVGSLNLDGFSLSGLREVMVEMNVTENSSSSSESESASESINSLSFNLYQEVFGH